MSKYLLVIQKSRDNYSAYSPDVPGCVSTGATIEDTIQHMTEALEFHFEGMAETGEPLPQPRGLESVLQAQRDTEGEDYVLAYVDAALVTPELGQPV